MNISKIITQNELLVAMGITQSQLINTSTGVDILTNGNIIRGIEAGANIDIEVTSTGSIKISYAP